MTKISERTLLALALVAMMLSSSSTVAFTSPQPTKTRLSQRGLVTQIPNAAPAESHGSKQVLYGSNGHDDLKDDWQTLKEAAGHIARNVGGKVMDAIQEGGSKLKDLVSTGAEKFATAFLPAKQEEPPAQSPLVDVHDELVDVHDEGLFRSLFGDEGVFMPETNSMDRVIDQAASVLKTDELATSLLGKSLRYGRPFSQKTQSTTINGRTTNSVQASLEVWGPQGQGVATVTSSDGELSSLDLEVNGRIYGIDPVASRANSETVAEQSPSGLDDVIEVHYENDGAMEVEVVGIRRDRLHPGRVLDAEILEKTLI